MAKQTKLFENVKTFILTAEQKQKKRKKNRNTVVTMESRCELWPQTTKRDLAFAIDMFIIRIMSKLE